MSTYLIQLSRAGLYCRAGDFHIDPWRPVAQAVITHGHADHARAGMGLYHVIEAGLPILRWRLGEVDVRAHRSGQPFRLGNATVSLHPAGHVLGSAQVRIEAGSEVWVVSGDFKRQADPTCAPFEVVRCDTFITEATFALPVYRWPDTARVVDDIVDWCAECGARGEPAVLFAYSLGKAQRLLGELRLNRRAEALGPILLHGAVAQGVAVYREAGVALADTVAVADEGSAATALAGRLVLAPPGAAGSPWLRRFPRARIGFASGWMQLRGHRRRRNVDRGFVVSDHADWPALLRTIAETGARRILAMHGDSGALVQLLRERGLDSATLGVEVRAASDDD